jgi:hypothetical protein
MVYRGEPPRRTDATWLLHLPTISDYLKVTSEVKKADEFRKVVLEA